MTDFLIATVSAIIGAVAGVILDRALITSKETRGLQKDMKKVYKWIHNEEIKQRSPFYTTGTIANGTNLTEERVRIACQLHPAIENLGNDQWGLRGFAI